MDKRKKFINGGYKDIYVISLYINVKCDEGMIFDAYSYTQD